MIIYWEQELGIQVDFSSWGAEGVSPSLFPYQNFVTSKKTKTLRSLNAVPLGTLNMSKLILLFLMLFSFACTNSKEEFDTSPLHDKELLPYIPFNDLIDAVMVFQKKYGEVPKDLSSLKKLSREDYLNACITDGVEDSILVDDSKLYFFSESETSFKNVPSGLEIQYSFKDSSLTFFEEWYESLYSTDFDSHTFERFLVAVNINKGKGIMKIDFISNQTSIYIEELTGSFGLSPAKEFHIINEHVLVKNSEPLCFEE